MFDQLILISFCNIPIPTRTPLLCARIDHDAGMSISFQIVPSGFSSPITTATGLTRWRDRIFFLFSSEGRTFISVLLQKDLAPIFFQELPEIQDGHSIYANLSGLFIVSTGKDEVVKYEISETGFHTPQVVWRASFTQKDSHHINSIIGRDGELFVSAFGPKESTLWASAKNGYIHNITRDLRIKDGIYHPHSLSEKNGEFYYCESHTGYFCSLQGPIFDLDGYTRGIGWLNDQIVCTATSVGRKVSRSTGLFANPADPGESAGQCALTIRNIINGEVISTADLSWFGPETYDVLILDNKEISPLQPGF